jgi:hypothetical protein
LGLDNGTPIRNSIKPPTISMHFPDDSPRRRAGPAAQAPSVAPEPIAKPAAIGITDVKRVLGAGRTEAERETLSSKSGVPVDEILRPVKLAYTRLTRSPNLPRFGYTVNQYAPLTDLPRSDTLFIERDSL